MTPEHLEEWWVFGTFFLVLGCFQLVFAVVVLRRPTRRVVLAGIVTNLAVVLVYVSSRTTGLPIEPPEDITSHAWSHVAEGAGPADLAATAAETDGPDQRRLTHQLYLDLAAFASSYLAHQDFEERALMPALFGAVGFEAVLGIHQAIVGAIPPEEMVRSLAVMLPAMNLDDRVELLGGMRAGAPAEVFQGVWSLAGSVLAPADHAALATRLDLS